MFESHATWWRFGGKLKKTWHISSDRIALESRSKFTLVTKVAYKSATKIASKSATKIASKIACRSHTTGAKR